MARPLRIDLGDAPDYLMDPERRGGALFPKQTETCARWWKNNETKWGYDMYGRVTSKTNAANTEIIRYKL